MNGRKRDIIILAATGMAFVIVIGIVGAINMKYAPVFTLTLYAGLIVVTMFYAYYSMEIARATREQADASIKMAEGMARPLIDIQMEKSADAHLSAGVAAASGDLSRGLSCILHNVGIGSAINVHSFIQDYQRERQRFDFGTLAVNGKTEPKSLSLEREGDRIVFIVYYKDIYGCSFESRKEVINKEAKRWELGPLEFKRI